MLDFRYMGSVIGIDFGTSNSGVSGYLNGKNQIIPDDKGRRITPSVVSFGKDRQIVIGDDAKAQLLKNPKRTVHSIKRLIGRKVFSAEVQKAKTLLPYEIVEGENQNAAIRIDDQIYAPQEIAALILKHMKDVAEQALKTPVHRCVITVPAYFNDAQRQTTKEACQIAGLEVMKMINEPTAAALAYGFGKKKNERIAVYDLGGGTFDISVLELRGETFEVIATAGDTFLGGDDFDDRLIDIMAEDFLNKTGVDLRSVSGALPLLRVNAEKTKRRLSYAEKSDVYVPSIVQKDGKSLDLHFTLSREQLRQACMDLIQKTFTVCDEAMNSAHLKPSELDAVIMVGGPTKMPMIQDAVEVYFGKKALSDLNPDEVVSVGASIQAQSLLADATQKALLLDVTPLDLGVATVGGFVETVIEKNTAVPAQLTKTFTTIRDDQDSVDIRVFQGKDRREEQSVLLGEFHLSGIRKARAGQVAIEVSFGINTDGIVEVGAVDKDTGAKHHIAVRLSATAGKDKVTEMAKRSQHFSEVKLKDDWKDAAKIVCATPVGNTQKCQYQEGLIRNFDPFQENFRLVSDDARREEKEISSKQIQWLIQLEDFANMPRYLKALHERPISFETKKPKNAFYEFKFKNGERIFGSAALIGENDVGFWVEPFFSEDDLPGRVFIFAERLESSTPFRI